MIEKEELVKLIEEGKGFKECLTILNVSSRKLKYYRKLYNLDRKIKPLISIVTNCYRCGNALEYMTRVEKDKAYCSKFCSNSRPQTDETKQAISIANKSKIPKIKFCKFCNKDISDKRSKTKFCSSSCGAKNYAQTDAGKQHHINIGKKSAEVTTKRSKNEVLFYDMCHKHFNNIEHNKPIFNGWDADVIIHDIKTAVLWNGKWHYEYIRGSQSLKQIQNRDRIKINEIIIYGYEPYIIKDMGRFSMKKVEEEFNIFIQKTHS